jgi:hypothetical protein
MEANRHLNILGSEHFLLLDGSRLALCAVLPDTHREDECLKDSDGVYEKAKSSAKKPTWSPAMHFTHGVGTGEEHRSWDHLKNDHLNPLRILIQF